MKPRSTEARSTIDGGQSGHKEKASEEYRRPSLRSLEKPRLQARASHIQFGFLFLPDPLINSPPAKCCDTIRHSHAFRQRQHGNNKYSEEAFDQFLIKTWSFCRIQGKNFN